MKKLIPVLLIALAALMMFSSGCEKFTEADDINGLFKKNELSVKMKVLESPGDFDIEKTVESSGGYYLKIDVTDTYSLRGEAAIQPGDKYKLSFTLKNTSADPVINYSFWEKPKTSLRHYTLKGENGNPPTSETQKVSEEWITFEETFETHEGEDSFLLTLHCGKGTFYIKEINLERIQ